MVANVSPSPKEVKKTVADGMSIQKEVLGAEKKKGSVNSRSRAKGKTEAKKNVKGTEDAKQENVKESKGTEVSKLKHQLRNLKKMNDFLSKKLDKMSKGHKELSNEHKVLKDSFRRMSVAEGQLAEELLQKVQERDSLQATLQKVMVERDELELMVHSFSQMPHDGMSDTEGSAASDSVLDAPFQSSTRKFHESFHSDVIFHHDSSFSDIEIFESFQPDEDEEDVDPGVKLVEHEGEEFRHSDGESSSKPGITESGFDAPESPAAAASPLAIRHARSYSEAQFRIEFGGEQLDADDVVPPAQVFADHGELKRKFKGRGTIRFYSVMEELWR